MKKEKKRLSKQMKKTLMILMGYLVCTAIITVLLWPYIHTLTTQEGRLQIKERICDYGILAPVVYIGLQIVQIVLAFIPGEPIEILSGVLFGTLGGLCYTLAGVLLGTTLVFFLVRKFGRPLVLLFFPEEQMEKYKILRDPVKLEWLVFLLFLIPGTPKDLLTYLVPLTPINSTKYLIIATFARIPSIITSVFVGSTLGEGNFKLSLIAFLATALLGAIGYFVNQRISHHSNKAKPDPGESQASKTEKQS